MSNFTFVPGPIAARFYANGDRTELPPENAEDEAVQPILHTCRTYGMMSAYALEAVEIAVRTALRTTFTNTVTAMLDATPDDSAARHPRPRGAK